MAATGFLEREQFFVREQVAFAKLTDTYEILDLDTRQVIGLAREAPPTWAKWMRLVVKKQVLPTAVVVTDQDALGAVLFRIRRGPTFWRAKVFVEDGNGMQLGWFRSKVFSLGGGFWVHDAQGVQVGEVKGDWKGWNFKLLDTTGGELGVVTKKWAGAAREIFTSADNYVVALSPEATSLPNAKILLLAAALAIDIVFKERE